MAQGMIITLQKDFSCENGLESYSFSKTLILIWTNLRKFSEVLVAKIYLLLKLTLGKVTLYFWALGTIFLKQLASRSFKQFCQALAFQVILHVQILSNLDKFKLT